MTASLRDQIQELAASFAAGVLNAIRGSSLEEILAQTGGAKRGRGRPPKHGLGAALLPPARSASGARGDSRRLARRSAGALERVVDHIVDLLEKSPKGLRAEQIRTRLGLSAKELPRPIAKALEAKRVRKVGQKRATTYFATGVGGAQAGGSGGKKARGVGRAVKKAKPAPPSAAPSAATPS